ncbi:trafficking protein particle complex subunit 10 [Elsinoe ampelina]|uniref:Trafficking protein particle complex subunit 10 n=1 Tax=Elsinoe ampelina TaxID=302913 RepID=A0A6A6G6W3_9PEZI|nr:trafficking protein particle complex subunit 10 [Elsinoe ampelina]
MEKSSSSKVTVEYHDPSGVFSLLQGELEGRLPLRNLNWKSPTRPLRNIDALHVEFVPDAATSGGPPASTGVPGAPERRHQIPGLRETPYLRLFILRCDDKDSYRAEHRQQLKDWVKRISPPTQSTSALNKHNNHDAFEWMIIHVNDPDELAERSKGKTKWTGKGTTTVFDKVRADFFPSSKHALERVAQIRLPKNVLSETSQEQENAWQDLIAKFKTLILQSFDLRVGQYEEDIREKESQRALPGWNFCTFFTLKETLARGFESVGLVEDALAIYDELAAGLDTTTNDNTAFLGDMSSLRRELVNLSTLGVDTEPDAHSRILELLDSPLDISRKDYRNLIVSSTISLFDFHTYIFARQRLLIYRLGSFEPQDEPPPSARTPQSTVTEKPDRIKSDEQLLHVAEVCKRASAFISSNTRTLRKEMETTSALIDQSRYEAVVQSVAASWAYTTSDKVLAETSVSLIYAPPGMPDTPSDAGFNFAQGANSYPTRRSSLITVPSATPKSSVVVYENDSYALSTESGPVKPATAGSGLAELAASRGELCLLQRRFLEALALKKDWRAGWAAFGKTSTRGELITPEVNDSAKSDHLAFLNSEILDALKSVDDFRVAYENVTDLAIRHLMLGSRISMVENLLGDLALMKYQSGDYTGAAQIFQKLVAKYTGNNWSDIEARMLHVYTKCLKILNRKDEYIRISLGLLRRNGRLQKGLSSTNTGGIEEALSLQQLVDFSKDSSNPFKAAFEDLFGDLDIDLEIKHFEDKDGFGISLNFGSTIDEASIDSVKLKLISTSAPTPELILSTEGPVQVTGGRTQVQLNSSASTLGLFSVQQIVVDVGKLQFIHNYEPKQKQNPFVFTERAMSKTKFDPVGPLVMVYPRGETLDVEIDLCPEVHIDKQRSVHLKLRTGQIEFDEIAIKLKPATAGLRLKSANATLIESNGSKLDIDSTNSINVKAPPDTCLTINIPYTLETSPTELQIKTEVSCSRSGQTSTFYFEDQISTDLLLDVDVNDIFNPDEMFSRFSIRTTNGDPLIVHSANIQGSKDYDVKALPCPADTPIFDRQPVSLACRIRKKQDGISDRNASALELNISYCSVALVVSDTLTQALDVSLKESDLSSFRSLMLYIFERLLVEQLTRKALEDTVLLQSFQLPSYDTLGWDLFLPVLPSTIRPQARSFLETFHANHTSVSITTTSLPSTLRRTLTIPVDIPTISLLATARLTLPSTSPSPCLPPLAIVGQPLPTTLTISYTTTWSLTPPPPTQTLVFTIPDLPESWLLAGPSTATFTAAPNTPTTFPLLLIPLVPGTLTLPNVEVHLSRPLDSAVDHTGSGAGDVDTPLPTPVSAVPSSTSSVRTVLDTTLLSPRSGVSPRTAGRSVPSSAASPGGGAGEGYACETNYESVGQTVLVVRLPGGVEVGVVEGVSTAYAGGGEGAAGGGTVGVRQEGAGTPGARDRASGSVDLLGMAPKVRV